MARKGAELGENDYVIRVLGAPGEVAPDPWNALLARESDPSPFMRHEYLHALQASGSAVPATGWKPRFVTLHRGAELAAACAGSEALVCSKEPLAHVLKMLGFAGWGNAIGLAAALALPSVVLALRVDRR